MTIKLTFENVYQLQIAFHPVVLSLVLGSCSQTARTKVHSDIHVNKHDIGRYMCEMRQMTRSPRSVSKRCTNNPVKWGFHSPFLTHMYPPISEGFQSDTRYMLISFIFICIYTCTLLCTRCAFVYTDELRMSCVSSCSQTACTKVCTCIYKWIYKSM